MTLSFLGNSEEARKIYNFCGSKSGRDFDKAKETGLTPVETDNGSIAFEQSRLTLECRKLYKDNMTAEKFLDKDLLQWYGAKGGFHDVYVVEITNADGDRTYIGDAIPDMFGGFGTTLYWKVLMCNLTFTYSIGGLSA